MGIGAYRHRVQLEQPAGALDPVDWDCALSSAASQVVDGLSAYFVRGRYHPGITLETQINFDGRTFQVQSVTDVDERHTELQLMCVEVVGRSSGRGPVLPVGVAPTITTPPVGSTIASGESVTLTVVAAGTPPLAYQWTLAGVDIAGATSASYMTGPLTTTGIYAVRVSNAFGSVTSTPVTVTIEVPASPLLTELVSYWTLDETTGTRVDVHGSADLTDTNGVGSAAGKIGAGASFVAASTQFLSHPDLTPLGNEDYTYAFWFRRGAAGLNTTLGLIGKGTSGSYASYSFLTSADGRVFFFFGDTSPQVYTPAVHNDLNWHCVLGWHDAAGDTINVQVDNGLVYSAPTGGVGSDTAGVVRIGATLYPFTWIYHEGVIDEVGVWRRLLTAAERTQLYNAGAGLAYPFA